MILMLVGLLMRMCFFQQGKIYWVTICLHTAEIIRLYVLIRKEHGIVRLHRLAQKALMIGLYPVISSEMFP